MNTLKYLLIFLAGAGVGVGGSAIFFKKKYETFYRKKADKDLEEMDAFYKERCENCGVTAEEDKEEENFEEVPKTEKNAPSEKRKGSFATPYGDYYPNAKKTADPAEKEYPKEEDVIHEKVRPKLIKREYFGMDGYSTRVLYYYTEDDALIPEESTYKDIIETDEVRDMIGDALTKYGFTDPNNLEHDIYVRNENRKTDYHIIKVIGSLSEDYREDE